MSYLYDKVSKKLDEIMKKEQNIDTIRESLSRKIRLNRYDVLSVLKELENDGIIRRDGDKIKRCKK